MGKVRVEFVADFGPKRGQTFAGVVVEAEYEAILRAALNKLNLRRSKKDLLLVLRDRYQGTRVLSADADLAVLLRDGATILLTTARPAVHVPKPPRWPWPGAILPGAEADAASLEAARAEAVAKAPGTMPQPADAVVAAEYALVDAPVVDTDRQAISVEGHTALGELHGRWAVLQGNVLPLVRKAISNIAGFTEKRMGSYIAFDYNAGSANQLPDMFPDPQALSRRGSARLYAAVRRECRGLLVCADTGSVLARRLPKFFNIEEVEETRLENLPCDGGMATLKLDGSLVSPFCLDSRVRWAGKAAIVLSVEEHVARVGLSDEATEVLAQNCTPIFEWCEAGSPVGVIGHLESTLTLLAVRDNVTGEFWRLERLRSLGFDVVETVSFDSLPNLLSETRLKAGVEGVVVRWPESGHMVKIKTGWWLALAASQKKAGGQPARALWDALQSVPLNSIPTQAVWQAVLDGDDDQLSLVYSSLTPDAQRALRSFASAAEQGIQILSQELREWAECAREATETDLARVSGGWPPAILAAYQRRSPSAERELRKFLMKMATAGKLIGLEALVGTYWDGGRQAMEYCGQLGTFKRAPAEIVAHVLGTYIPRKVEQYMGYPMTDAAVVRVTRLYDPSEGKIKGLWEQFEPSGIIDLRVDLQPRDKVLSFHNGDSDFAHWQVQFGPNDNCPRSTKAKDGDRKGAFAGVLLRTGVDIEFGLLRDAFKLSFESQKVVRIDPSPSKISHIYLDLDGVLVDFEAGFTDAFGGLPENSKVWQHIEKTPGFFTNLPWMSNARRLWNHVCQLNVPTSILTGIPEGSLGERSAAEKAEWVARELGNVELIMCLSRDKPSYSGPGRLLVDDRPQKGWEVAGGRQIVHRNVSDTLSGLTNLGLGVEFSVPLDKISVVTRVTEELRAARAEAEVVAIDAEWPPDRAGATPNKATVLQLAFRPCHLYKAFVVDMLAWDDELQSFLQDMLASALPKLVFGAADLERLQMRVNAITDVQEQHESLAPQARKVGLLVKKQKQLQAADWSVRPLRDEQIVYAATDAAVLLELEGGHALKKSHQGPATGGRNATVEYLGVFLTSESRQKLLRRVPPRFSEVMADHMTLIWMPGSIKGLCVGTHLKLTVTGVGLDDKIQAVSVVTNEACARNGHVTISHKQDVEAKEANGLDFSPLESFTLDGVLGVGVLLGGVDKETLSGNLLDRVMSLTEGQPGQSERFENITDSQRYALHMLADELGLKHESEGKKGSEYRKLILTVPKRWNKAQAKMCSQFEHSVVKDARKFAAIFGDVPGLQLHGRVARSGISWQPGVMLPPSFERLVTNAEQGRWMQSDRVVVIMRGFPGSGKSSVAAWLKKQVPSELVSADDFFTDTGNLQAAHEQCRQCFLDALKAQKTIIVDNTNVSKSEYGFYQNKAHTEGYEVVVLELVCESTTELERFRKRSVHSVPGGAVGNMWTRWQADPAALRLAPYAT